MPTKGYVCTMSTVGMVIFNDVPAGETAGQVAVSSVVLTIALPITLLPIPMRSVDDRLMIESPALASLVITLLKNNSAPDAILDTALCVTEIFVSKVFIVVVGC